ncbi:HIT domain-containing protein [Dehalococcoides mccartyi]|nr:HIT domain-containing protein [Dehalococcoides mccartyi]
MSNCPFCQIPEDDELLIEGEICYFRNTNDPVLVGSGMILPRAHRETVFDLTDEEWKETQFLLKRVKAMLDEKYQPDGYNVGWNCGESGGMSIPHAHMHVIPRYTDEPLAGKGIRYHLKQPENRRPE